MKISAAEFARLTELLHKGNALTDDERSEKATIEAKIVAAEEDPAPTGEPSDESDESGETDPADDATPPAGDPAPAPESDDADLVDDEKAFGRLSIGDKFRALTASRAGLITRLNAYAAQIATLGSQLTAALARATTAESALAEATASLTASQARVAALEADAKDLHTAVTDELAGLGVKAGDLPPVEASGSEGTPGSEAELEERLKECQTHAERMTLIKAYKAKQAAAAKQKAA